MSGTPLALGTYDAFSPRPTDSTGTVTVTCFGTAKSASVTYQIKFLGNPAGRRMDGNGHGLVYQLYTDPSHTRVWGDCSGGTSCVTDSIVVGPRMSRRSYTAYGRAPPHQQITAGSFVDTVSILMTY